MEPCLLQGFIQSRAETSDVMENSSSRTIRTTVQKQNSKLSLTYGY
jgi:hypothetical protein